METNLALLNLPGGNEKPKSLADFTWLVECEKKLQYNNLVDEFEERNVRLMHIADRKVAEYEFISNIIALNTIESENLPANPALVFKVETQVAALSYDTVSTSFTLSFWRSAYGEKMIVPVLCDIVAYFINQFEVKDRLTYNQIIQIVSKLLSAQPMLRVMELVFVLNKALNGEYGPTYQRIGIDTVLGWLQQFFKDSSAHLETKKVNNKPEEARGEMPWLILEHRIKQYQNEIKQKAEANTRAYALEKRKREIEEQVARLKPA